MVESGAATQDWGDEILQDFSRLENSPDSIMITPTVLQIVARETVK